MWTHWVIYVLSFNKIEAMLRMIPVEGNMQSLTSKLVFKKRWLKYKAGFFYWNSEYIILNVYIKNLQQLVIKHWRNSKKQRIKWYNYSVFLLDLCFWEAKAYMGCALCWSVLKQSSCFFSYVYNLSICFVAYRMCLSW